MSLKELSQEIKRRAQSLGFFRTGITKAEPLDSAHLDAWLTRSFHGDMAWMQNRRHMRLDPSSLVPGAKSVIVCAINYYTPFETTTEPEEGRISRYAWRDDYHDVIRARLKELPAFIQELAPRPHNRHPKLNELAGMEIEAFRERYRKSPIKRAKLEGLRRSIKIARENGRGRKKKETAGGRPETGKGSTDGSGG